MLGPIAWLLALHLLLARVISPLYLPYLSPISPLDLPHISPFISPTSPQVRYEDMRLRFEKDMAGFLQSEGADGFDVAVDGRVHERRHVLVAAYIDVTINFVNLMLLYFKDTLQFCIAFCDLNKS